jgi:hypothetical protein
MAPALRRPVHQDLGVACRGGIKAAGIRGCEIG